jgi:hypothetical protein
MVKIKVRVTVVLVKFFENIFSVFRKTSAFEYEYILNKIRILAIL